MMQRRLRHVRNFYLYNLNVHAAEPDKMVKKLPMNGLGLSKAKSFTDLNSSFQNGELPETKDNNNQDDINIDPRSQFITSSDPFEKQKGFQKLNQHRIVDTFISLHDIESDQIVHITEVQYRDMNPYFTEIDLSALKFSKAQGFRLKIWCCIAGTWTYFMRLDVKLSALIFIGESLSESQFNSDNIIIIELVDGFYMLPTQYSRDVKIRRRSAAIGMERYSSSFDQLMKLNNLMYCINDSEKNKSALSAKLSNLLSQKDRNILKDSIQLLNINISELQDMNNSTKTEISRLQSKIDANSNYMHKVSLETADLNKLQQEAKSEFGRTLSDAKSVEQSLRIERSKVINVLRNIFPIRQLNNYSNEYKLLDHQLPLSMGRTQITKHKALEIAFVLNMVSQVVNLLSYYLSIPLRYPIEIFGSNSYIHDLISQLSLTMFPLWLNNLHNIEKFEYALLLLNKDIEQLLESIGIKSIDSRNILGNLNILFICLSDNLLGTDEHSVAADEAALIRKRIRFIEKKKSKLLHRKQAAI